MISTKAEVLNYIKEATENLDFNHPTLLSAKCVSQTLSISRSLASQYLNDLYREKILIKISSRPVLYLHEESIRYMYGTVLKHMEYLSVTHLRKELNFEQKHDGVYDLIGSRGTLLEAVGQMKASVSYPSYGLPLLLIGQEGTGKKALVRSIYKYAVENRYVSKDHQYVYIDLKEESLMECLENSGKNEIGFIHLGGIEYATPEESLLLLKIVLRETEHLEKARLLLSTEEVSGIDTNIFESIPLKVNLLNLEDRYREERREFVIAFLKEESQVLKRTIRIQKQALDILIDALYPDQIKGLQRTIKSVCARAHAGQNNTEQLDIQMHHLDLQTDFILRDPLVDVSGPQSLITISDVNFFDERLLNHYRLLMLNSKSLTKYVSEYQKFLLKELEYDLDHVFDIKEALTNLFRAHPQIKSTPSFKNLTELIAIMIYTIKRFDKHLSYFEHVNQHLLSNILLNTKNRYVREWEKVELVSLSIYNYLGIKINIINEIVLIHLMIRP